MARFSDRPNFNGVLNAAALWRANCLLKDGSVFTDDNIWTLSNPSALRQYFVEAPMLGNQRFIEKLRQQLLPTAPGPKRLAAEAIWFMELFPSNVGPKFKVARIQEVWSWSGGSLDATNPLLGAPLENGIGSTGSAFNTRFPTELSFLIKVMGTWKGLEPQERDSLLSDGWKFGTWLDQLSEGASRQQRCLRVLQQEQGYRHGTKKPEKTGWELRLKHGRKPGQNQSTSSAK